MLKYWRWAAILLAVLVVFDLGLSLGASCPANQPASKSDSAASQPEKHCSIEQSATYRAARGFVHLVESGEHFLIAISTVVIAIFTIVLGVATAALGHSTKALVQGADATAIRQLRAYLSVTPTFLQGVEAGETPSASFMVKNSGQTPAYHYRFAAILEILDHPLVDHQGDLVVTDASTAVPDQTVHPNDPRIGRATGAVPLTAKDITAIKSGKDRQLYLAGIVWYRDTFHIERKTKFCVFVDGPKIAKLIEAGKKVGADHGRMEWIFSHVHNEAT